MVDTTLWETDPERAAKMAFMETMCEWHARVEQGIYAGVPDFGFQSEEAKETALRRVVVPDTNAGVHAVPAAVERLWASMQCEQVRVS